MAAELFLSADQFRRLLQRPAVDTQGHSCSFVIYLPVPE
jgi:hypothetical protein